MPAITKHIWDKSLVVMLLVMLTGFVGCSTKQTTAPPNPKPQTAYVADKVSNDIFAYAIDGTTGALNGLAGSPLPASCSGPVMFAVTPSHQFVYVPCEFGNTFSTFAINQKTGMLTPVSTFLSDANPFAATIDPTGKFLYIANGGGNSVTGYSINATTGTVTAIAGARAAVNFAPNGLAIDPTGTFMYVSTLSGSSGDVEGFSIDSSGALTALPGLPFASFLATAIKMHPSGKYVYAADEASAVRAFSLNAGSGALTELGGSPFPAGNEPFGFALDPAGKFLYTANFLSNDVSAYAIDSNTGSLTPVTGSPFHVGTSPQQVTVDATGRFVYVPSAADNDVWAFTINGTTGALTIVAGAPFAAGIQPSGVVTVQ